MPEKWWTAGYLGHKVDKLEAARAELGAVVVDIRIRPQSRLPMWRQAAMVRYFGDDYAWCEDWGSPRFKDGPPFTMLDAEAGWETVEGIKRPVILLCACRDFDKCHRQVLSAWLESEHGVATHELEW